MKRSNGKRRSALLSACVLAGGLATEAPGQLKTWIGGPGTGTWSNPALWSPAGVPTAAQVALLTQSDASDRNVVYSSFPGGNAASTVVINATGTGAMTLTQAGGIFNANQVTLGSTANGIFNRTAGGASIGTLLMGSNVNGNGTLNVSGGGLAVTSSFRIGNAGAGTLLHTGGIINVTTTPILLGESSGASGNLQLWGGSFTAGTLVVGNAGAGTVIDQSPFPVNITSLKIGNGPTGAGTYQFGPAGGDPFLNAGSIEVGVSGIGRFIKGGNGLSTVQCSGSVFVGGSPGSGQFDMNAGTLRVGDTLFVGGVGEGTFAHNEGIVDVPNSVQIGPNGRYNLTTGGSLKAGSINLVAGTFNQSGGVIHSTASFVHAGGTVTGHLLLNSEYIYNSGSFTGKLSLAQAASWTLNANLTIDGGLDVLPNAAITLPLGRSITLGGSGLTLTGGGGPSTFIQRGNITTTALVVDQGSDYTQNSGVLALNGDLAVGAVGTGNYSLNLGILTMAGAPASAVARVGPGTFNVNSANATVVLRNLELSGGQLNHAGAGTGPGSFRVLGTASIGKAGGGRYLMSGSGAIATFDALNLGDTGPGFLQIDAGTFNCSGLARIGITSAGTFDQNGGRVFFGGDVMLDENDNVAARMDQRGGTLSIAGNVVNNGTMQFTGFAAATAGNLDGTGAVSMGFGSSLSVNRIRQSKLSFGGPLESTARVRIRPNGGDAATSRLGTITFVTTVQLVPLGTLDLTNNDLVVDYDTFSALANVRGHIIHGYNGGAWDGTGVTTSMGDASNFALGYAEASDLFTTFPATFAGQQVDDTTVLVAFTRYGDANLDGTVNLNDFNRLAANFGISSGAVWSMGDFTYDGIVNLNDFNRLAANFGLSAAGPEVTPGDWAALASAVPEPAGLAGSLACLAEVVGRQRWRRGRKK